MDAPASDDQASLLRIARVILATMLPNAPSLIAGRPPDGWPPELVPPSPVSTLGGMGGGNSLMALFRYPPSSQTPVAEFRAFLENQGWKPPHDPFGGGFDIERMATMCSESLRATLVRATTPVDENAVMVSIAPNEGWPYRGDPRMPDLGTIKIPRLVAPPGVQSDGGGGGGSGDTVNRRIRVTTSLTPAELLPFYTRQLADAGWLTGVVEATAVSAVQWLEASDERGRVWRGMLTVYANASAREVFIYMATADTSPPWRAP